MSHGIFETVDVKTFGAVGDGVTDSSLAFSRAIAYANQLSTTIKYQHGRAKVKVPAGVYKIVTGVSVVNLYCDIEGDGAAVTIIDVTAGQYFLTVTDTITQFCMSGISFTNGKGYIAHTALSVNVQAKFDILNCAFYNYTECAIGSLCPDFPYWNFRNCLFYGASGLTSKGVVHSGNPDNVVFDSCSFLRNRYHVKIQRGNNLKFLNCDFIRFNSGGGSPILVDLWIVPYSSSVNAGAGLEIVGCKFGNETQDPNDVRILIADEGSGTNSFDKNHSTSVSTGYLDGIAIRGGYAAGTSGQVRGFIYSYTPNVRNIQLDDVYFDGTRYPYIIEFAAGVTVPNDRLVDSWSINAYRMSGPFEQPFGAVSNISTVNFGRDPYSLFFGRPDFISNYPTGTPIGFQSLWNQANAGATAMSATSASKSNITDALGDADAVEVTYSATNGFLLADVDTPTANRLAWADVDVKAAASLALTQVIIRVDNSAGDILAQRIVYIPSTWQRIRIPFIPRSTGSGIHLVILPYDYSAGVKTKVQIGRPIVYHATDQSDPGLRYLSAKKTHDWASITSGSSATTTLTVPGAEIGDFCLASMSVSLSGLMLTAYVSASDVVTIVAANFSGAPIDLGSGILRVRVQKFVKYA
jgi:hypothetical protein